MSSFTRAGYYKVKIHVDVVWTPGTGDDTWVGQDEAEILETVVGVGEIRYQLNGAGDWKTMPGSLGVVTGSTIAFQALPAPTGAAWPTENPQWINAAGQNMAAGDTGTANLNVDGAYIFAARCGNQMQINITAAAVPPIYEYGPTPGLVADGSIQPDSESIPTQKTDLQFSPGETATFLITAFDNDRRREVDVAHPKDWEEIAGTGPYDITWTVSEGASFGGRGRNIDTLVTGTEASGSVNVYIDPNWNGDTITVSASVEDSAPDPVAAPDTGTAHDNELSVTWTLKLREKAPTTINFSPITPGALQGEWYSSADFRYQVGPDIGTAGRPDYEGQTVQESFSPPSAGGLFSLDDLTDHFREAVVGQTADQIAPLLFPVLGDTGTFVIDGGDYIYDHHQGFGDERALSGAFKTSALTRDEGIGYQVSQTYSSGPNTLGTYTLKRQFSTKGGIPSRLLMKTGP